MITQYVNTKNWFNILHIRKRPSQYWDVGAGDEFRNSCLTLDDDEEIILGIDE